jgi:hypothetical protein
MATLGGAACLNMGTQTGSLQVGKAFDALLMDAAKVRLRFSKGGWNEIGRVCLCPRRRLWVWKGIRAGVGMPLNNIQQNVLVVLCGVGGRGVLVCQ